MFQSYAYRNAFSFNLYIVGGKPAVYIPGRVTGGKYHRTEENLAGICFNAFDFILLYEQSVHACFEVNLATALDDSVPHVFNDTRQFVRTYVRMCIYQYRSGGSMLAEDVQNLVYITALFAACVQLAIRVGSGTSLSEAVIGLRVDELLAADLRQVFLAFPYVLSTFHNDGAQTELYQAQSGEESSGTGAYHYYLVFSFYIII